MIKFENRNWLIHLIGAISLYAGIVFTCSLADFEVTYDCALDSSTDSCVSTDDCIDSNVESYPIEDSGSGVAESGTEELSGQPDRDIHLALTKICVSEAGFQVRTRDCDLIYEVLRNRSVTGEISMGIMRAYARKAFDEDREDNRMWIPHLNREFTEPRGWSGNVTVPWHTRRDKFIEVYNYVGDLLRRNPGHTCGVRIDHWGARGFRRDLHLSRGWRLLDCGKTHNDFWSLPRRRSEDRVASEETEHETSS
ncbi:MAG: hypothetical protein EBZ49_07570 [Proteobacteria bacterium]|nr:hypothetical protein [Pseudomonadota bacterium]